MLSQYVDAYQLDWDKYLPLCAFQYNSTVNSQTGYIHSSYYMKEKLHNLMTYELRNAPHQKSKIQPSIRYEQYRL